MAETVAHGAASADKQLANAARQAEDAAKKAEDAALRLALRALKATQVADSAQADAARKFAKAAASGKAGDKRDARKAADDATSKARDAARALQDAAAAKATAGAAADAVSQAHDDISRLADTILDERISDRFPSIAGVAAGLTGEQVSGLASGGNDGLLSITPDTAVELSAASKWTSDQDWPYASGAANNWTLDRTTFRTKMPAIAIVDSGIEDRADFDWRLVASVNLSTLATNSPGDGRGHGTFVAGIAGPQPGAGAGPHHLPREVAALASHDALGEPGGVDERVRGRRRCRCPCPRACARVPRWRRCRRRPARTGSRRARRRLASYSVTPRSSAAEHVRRERSRECCGSAAAATSVPAPTRRAAPRPGEASPYRWCRRTRTGRPRGDRPVHHGRDPRRHDVALEGAPERRRRR